MMWLLAEVSKYHWTVRRSTGTDPGYRTRLRRNWTGVKPTGLPMFLGGTGPLHSRNRYWWRIYMRF